jgi:hypothetical protein
MESNLKIRLRGAIVDSVLVLCLRRLPAAFGKLFEWDDFLMIFMLWTRLFSVDETNVTTRKVTSPLR